MIKIEIDEETETIGQMPYVLRLVAEKIEEGYHGGFEPTWQLSGDEEPIGDE